MVKSIAQRSPIQAFKIPEQWTCTYSSWIKKIVKNKRSNCQHPWDHQKKQEILKKRKKRKKREKEKKEKKSTSASFFIQKSLTVGIKNNCLKSKVEFSPPHVWKSGWWFSTIKCGNMYISHMKILALSFWRKGEPIWKVSSLYFTNENQDTTVSS